MAASPPPAKSRKLMSFDKDPMTLSQPTLDFSRQGPNSYALLDKHAGSNTETGSMTWIIEFNDKNPDQTKRRSWTIPDDMDAGLREISDLRTTSSVAVSAMWKPDSEPPRFIVSIDFPKDVVLVCQTVLKYIKPQDFRTSSAFRTFMARPNSIKYMEHGTHDMVIETGVTVQRWLTDKDYFAGTSMMPASNAVLLQGTSSADRAIALDNLKALANKYGVKLEASNIAL